MQYCNKIKLIPKHQQPEKTHQGKARKPKKPQVNDLLDRLLDDDDDEQ
jgi:hypothetical protein